MTSTGFQVFEAGDIVLQSGMTLRNARLAYKTHGRLNADGTNAIIFPTRIQGTHRDNEFMIGHGQALDPERWFIIVPDLFGNGLSSSPSNTAPPFDRARFPELTLFDCVQVQHRLATEVLGVRELALAVGWSMGAQQAYHWAALFPGMVKRLAVIAGAAKTTPHGYVFLEGMRAVLTTDPCWKGGWYDEQPRAGLRAMARAWAGWGFSQAFYRNESYRNLGYSSPEDFIVGYWEGMFMERDANNMLAQIGMWQRSDISANPLYDGDFRRALAGIRALAFVMPGRTDMYFPPEDSAFEVAHMPNAQLRVIESEWGHAVGGGRNPADRNFIDRALHELLSTPC